MSHSDPHPAASAAVPVEPADPAEPHPLLAHLHAAADGRFPEIDGGVTILPPLADGLECSYAFTGHAFIATALSEDEVHAGKPDGYGGAMLPSFLAYLAGPDGETGLCDATLVRYGLGAPEGGGVREGGGVQESGGLPLRTDLDDHSRVRYARALRRDVRVYGDERGLVTLSAGLAGRLELSIELFPGAEGRGRSLLDDALAVVPQGDPVFAAVSPGNARSLRMFLTAGFTPIGGEAILRPRRTVHKG